MDKGKERITEENHRKTKKSRHSQEEKHEDHPSSPQYSTCIMLQEPSSKKPKSDDGNMCSQTYNNSTDKLQLSEEDLAELRRLLKERRNLLKKTPHLTLKEPSGLGAELETSPEERVPILFSDIQHLVLFAVLAQNSPFIPRWCHLEKCGHLSAVQILFIEGLGISDYLQAKQGLTSLDKTDFQSHLEVIMPAAYNGDLIEEFCSIPLSRSQKSSLTTAYGSVEEAAKSSCEVFKVLRAIFPVNEKNDKPKTTPARKEDQEGEVEACRKISLPPTDKFPRTMLLLSVAQMIEEGYPIPLNLVLKKKFKDFVQSKAIYEEVNNCSPMYGIDCEMCTTTIGLNECTRVSIVNEKLETILDTLVLPYNRITNYLTRFSGITRAMMKNVTTRLEDVQKFIQENIEPDAIFVGQSLNFDLVALKLMHPYCIDTSVIFNMTGDRYRKSKLRLLAEHFLKESIQSGSQGHCSVEDSSAALRLVQLKLSESIDFGDQVLLNQGISQKDLVNEKSHKCKEEEDTSGYATSLFSYASRMSKCSAIVGSPELLERYMDFLNPQLASYEQINSDGSHAVIAQENASSSGRITCFITSSNQSVAETLATKAPDNFLSIGHIQLSEEEANSIPAGDTSVLQRLNNWVSQMQSAVPSNGLSIVVMCGREKSSNGVCFVNLKKLTQPPVNFQPHLGTS